MPLKLLLCKVLLYIFHLRTADRCALLLQMLLHFSRTWANWQNYQSIIKFIDDQENIGTAVLGHFFLSTKQNGNDK